MLLMPSEYEPCGLSQMRAQRYGALVIGDASAAYPIQFTTTQPAFCSMHLRRARSIKPSAAHCIGTTTAMRGSPASYEAMGRDFGWDSSATRYVQMYRRALARANPES
jgi:starch synthase